MEKPIVEAMTAVIETDLGPLHITISEDFGLSGRIPEVVTINRVDYGVEAAAHLDRQTEEWRVVTWVYRAVQTNSNFYAMYRRGDQLYQRATDGSEPTQAARKFVKEGISKTVQSWIDKNYQVIIAGHYQALLRRVQQSREIILYHKMHADSGLDKVTQIEESVMTQIALSETDKSFLDDVANRFYARW